MGKRVTIKYLGGSHYTAMQSIPAGMEFKATWSDDPIDGGYKGVYIRGSSLTKAAKGMHEFTAKKYLFIIDHPVMPSQMEVVA